MKVLSTSIAAALLCTASPIFADTKVVLGCEVYLVPDTNYYNKSDPSCNFAGINGGNSGFKPTVSTKPDPDDNDDDEGEEPDEDGDEDDDGEGECRGDCGGDDDEEGPGDEDEPGDDDEPGDGEEGPKDPKLG